MARAVQLSPVVVGVSRLGIDLGGVICKHMNDVAGGDGMLEGGGDEAPGVFDAVQQLVALFGAEHCFIVSKLGVGGPMQTRSERWLESTRFYDKTGFLRCNVVFCNEISGIQGKGVQAKHLQLSHFIDDRSEALSSVYADPAGNSGDCVRRHRGGPTLFHFARSGLGTAPPRPPARMPDGMGEYYAGVANWADVLRHFAPPTPGPAPAPAPHGGYAAPARSPPSPAGRPESCANGCGRGVNGGYSTCCSRCTGPDSGHSSRCGRRDDAHP
eukprot:TRINITY_DN3286_c0_g2_i1.p1 TRINITY_DN3286_c0_g2~~TRINITY_DN3286_c0_g2_i1.p1  ORF type:complete len:270 (+),score=55.58 TRINITY_DN3286_c0_g2_i1:604-1413(+)